MTHNNMITISVSASVSGGTAPYTFTYSSNNSNVTFSNVTGTATSIGNGEYSASTDVEYLYQNDIDTTIVSVAFVDANGCSTVLTPVVVDNPCDLQSTISTNGELVFVATTTGGSGSYTYDWNYDDTLFTKKIEDTDPNDNYLSLELDSKKPLPSSTTIQVTITDGNGCMLQKSYSYNFCQPTWSTSERIGLLCDATPITGCNNVVSQYRNLNLFYQSRPCTNQTIDWSTLTFNVPTGLCVKHNNFGLITYISSSLSTAQTKTITYTVKTTAGITSTVGYLTVSIPDCSESRTVFDGVPTTIQLTADDSVSDIKYIPVETRVSGTPDWSTFTFTNTPAFGNVTLDANRDIQYEITDLATTPDVPDVIKWSMNDYDGGQINITDTVLRDVIAVPSTVTEVICSSCGQVVGPEDLLANDTGDIDRSTVAIVLNDPQILITKDTDNNFTFTTLPGASFNNLCSYKVANTQGAFAPDQNFFVRAACVGSNRTPVKDLTCNATKTFNIADQFTDDNCFGYSFTETSTISPDYTTQGGLIGGGGDVDFTGINYGTYTFEFTCLNQGGCSPDYDDVATLTVINGESPSISFTSATDNGNGTSTYEFDYVGISSSFYITLNGSVPSYQSTLYTDGTTGTFTIYNVAGLNTVIVQGTTVCGNTTNDTDASITV